MLSGASIDPTFNGGQAVVSPADAIINSSAPLNNGSAVAVQANGKIVIVGASLQDSSAVSTNSPHIAVRRLNADGSSDTTFGTSGEIDLPMPAGTYDTAFISSQVLIQDNGKIVLAAELAQSSVTFITRISYTPLKTVVFGLNADGSVDTSFGTGGRTIISTDSAALTHLALQKDGKIVVGSTATVSSDLIPLAVTRLNADGTVDSSFNGGSLLLLDPAIYGGPFNGGISPHTPFLAGLVVTPDQKVALATSISPNGDDSKSNYEIIEFNADGTPDTAFGPNGAVQGTAAPSLSYTYAAIGDDGKFVLVGHDLSGGIYATRVNADGSRDTSFASTKILLNPTALVIQPDGKVVIGGGTPTQFISARLNTTGTLDKTYGPGGFVRFSTPIVKIPLDVYPHNLDAVNDLAVTKDGHIVLLGTNTYYEPPIGSVSRTEYPGSQVIVARLRISTPVAGDYDGDGIADIAAQVANYNFFAVRQSSGTDVLNYFGVPGIGETIPVSGDFDGDGKADVAAYIPSQGVFAYRPSSGGSDRSLAFGTAGFGASIPAPGDYDGDGKTDLAVYLPASGSFAVHPSNGSADYFVPFGTPGTGASIPAPGDYDGDGKTDFAVYLSASGILAYRPSRGGNDVLTRFGSAGFGLSIPAPGDYDGDGKTDIAVYLPTSASFAIQFSSDGSTAIAAFGAAGPNASIPAPGDYDGDGKTDLAVYLPASGVYAYRSTVSQQDILQSFGVAGLGQTVPAPSVTYGQFSASVVRSNLGRASAVIPSAAVFIPLTEDLTNPTTGKKKSKPA